MTSIIKYINSHIGEESNILIRHLINKYIHSSYAYYNIEPDGKEIIIQPGWKEKWVIKFSIYSDKTMAYNHKTQRLVLMFSDNTSADISLYKFKRFARKYIQ